MSTMTTDTPTDIDEALAVETERSEHQRRCDEQAQVARRTRRRRATLAITAGVLAVGAIAGHAAYTAHQEAVAEREAMLERVATAVEADGRDQFFYTETAAAAQAQMDAAAVAAHQARVDAALADIDEAVEAATEILDAADGRVLDSGEAAVADLQAAIDSATETAEQYDTPGATLTTADLREVPGTLDAPVAAVEQAVEAYEEEQARLEREQQAREAEERRQAEEREREQQQAQQAQAAQQSSSSPSRSSTPSNSSSNSSSTAPSRSSNSNTSTAQATRGEARRAAESVAAQHGYTVQWRTAVSDGRAGYIRDDGYTQMEGMWTSASPRSIQMSVGTHDPDGIPAHAAGMARALALHEVAHGEIYRICGTPCPPIAGDRHEQVTTAYAHVVLGAPASNGGYTATPNDISAARSIHAGVCE